MVRVCIWGWGGGKGGSCKHYLGNNTAMLKTYLFHFGDCSGSGTHFLKVPKLFGRISGCIILFVSSKGRRLEAGNFAFILIFIPFTTYEKTDFPELAGRSFTNGFSGPKSFPHF